MKHRILKLIAVPLLAPLAAMQAAEPVDFVRDVRPIFEKRCHACHGATKQKSGLRLDVRAAAFEGGDGHGPSIVPNKAGESPLIQLVTSDNQEERMPLDGPALSKAQIDLLARWINEGAVWPDGVDVAKLEDTRDHWSFQPLRPPPGEHSIDAFIRAKLEEHGLALAPAADRRVWLRRVTLDLTGLPPTPAEAEEFGRDQRADAYERIVDRLLTSERYGERWAQHWLDVVRYADTHGFEVNTERPNAWPYRDYVIRALNTDTPYDRFVKEQIVGDALGEDAATGFLVTASVLLPGQIGKDAPSVRLARQDSLDEIVNNIAQTFLGLSVGCARCHDHKFDPITAKDYYAMQAFVAGVEYEDREYRIESAESGQKAFAGKFRTPDAIRLLNRGDPEQPKEEVVPAVLSALGNVALTKQTPEQDRRQALADWIASPDNPLTARVMVNRVWQWHFGIGLVETPSDFGRNGARPTHPELLDWLAAEFIRNGWSVKHMHRLVVLSDSYRQSSRPTTRGAEEDADVHLLWRYPSRRIEAEAIRDSMLAVSGCLNLQMYGRGFDLFDKRGGLSGFEPVETLSPENQRRMIYAHKVRRETEAVFGAFDCPDAGQSTALRRASTTPIQALNLFNSRITLELSEAFAARVSREAGDDDSQQIDRAFQLALSRRATLDEIRDAEPVVRQHGLAGLCRVLFNTSEFLFLP